MKSGFSLNGFLDFDLDDKCLQITDLGNIYISKVDYLKEDDFLVHRNEQSLAMLSAQIDEDSVNIVSNSLEFEVNMGDEKFFRRLNLLIVLDFDEFFYLQENIRDNIFLFKNDAVLFKLDDEIFSGSFEAMNSSFYLKSGQKKFNFDYLDVEDIHVDSKKISFEGYFLLEGRKNIVRKVEVVGNISNFILSKEVEEIVKNNRKIGHLDSEDELVFSRISGRLGSKEYYSNPVFFVKTIENFIIYDRYNKNEVLKSKISDFSMFNTAKNKYILFNSIDVFDIEIEVSDAEKIGLDNLDFLLNDKIGYTKNGHPFFLNFEEKNIVIYKSINKSVLNIEKSKISDISVIEDEDIGNSRFVEVEIKFSDRLVRMFLRRKMVMKLSSKVFHEYQNSIIDSATIYEVYQNWIKSVLDMLVYNFYGNIYHKMGRYLEIRNSEDQIKKIDEVNKLYEDIDEIILNLDKVCIYMSEILENNEINYFKTLDKTVDTNPIRNLSELFFDIRRNIKDDFEEINRCIENISFIILPETLREETYKSLANSDIYMMELQISRLDKKIDNLIYNLLPFYVSKTVVSVYEVYIKFFKNYSDIPESSLKEELLKRIQETHIFKQFAIENSIHRKDIIEDLYSLTKFGEMKIDSDFYYTGGYVE